MAELPKIDSEGLRLAKREGAARVSSVVNVSRQQTSSCLYCHVRVERPCLDSKQAGECPCTNMPDR
jgi:hypothetical protein